MFVIHWDIPYCKREHFNRVVKKQIYKDHPDEYDIEAITTKKASMTGELTCIIAVRQSDNFDIIANYILSIYPNTTVYETMFIGDTQFKTGNKSNDRAQYVPSFQVYFYIKKDQRKDFIDNIKKQITDKYPSVFDKITTLIKKSGNFSGEVVCRLHTSNDVDANKFNDIANFLLSIYEDNTIFLRDNEWPDVGTFPYRLKKNKNDIEPETIGSVYNRTL